MASTTLNVSDIFPDGTSVSAYLRSQWPVEGLSGAPSGSAVVGPVTVSAGHLTFSGLADGARYVAYAGSPDRFRRFTTDSITVGGVIDGVNTVAASGAAQTLPDVTTATVHQVTLTANCTITFPSPSSGRSLTVVLVQDATGSRTVTWPAAVKWQGGTAPTLTTTASKRDVFTFLCVDGTNWLGFVSGQNFS